MNASHSSHQDHPRDGSQEQQESHQNHQLHHHPSAHSHPGQSEAHDTAQLENPQDAEKAVHGREIEGNEGTRSEADMEHHSHHQAHQQQLPASDHTGHATHAGHTTGAAHEDHAAHVDHSGHEDLFRRRFWVSLVLSIPVLLYSEMIQQFLGFSMPVFPGSRWIEPLFAIIVFLYGGVPFLKMAVPELRNRQPGMMTLISLAITVAMVYSLADLLIPGQMSFFWELVTLIVIMLLGHWLEMRSVRQASGALTELAKLLPDTAERITPDGQVQTIPMHELVKNDLLLIRPGAAIPADGVVEEGQSEVNESMITGESRPVKKEPASKVIAGTINGDGSLRVKVTAVGDETDLAGIMRLVKEAQQSKSPTQLLADKAAGWLFYIALAVAALTAIIWSLAVGFNIEVIERVATVLVIACPHALGLAIPLVVAITTALGAQNGILVRDRLAMEQARQIDTIIFDKTGTLTRGEFGVTAIQTAPGWEENQALALAAAVEGDSEHTLAKAIRNTAAERGLDLPAVTDFEAIKGRGVRAIWKEHTIHLGGPRMLEMLELSLPAEIDTFERQSSQNGHSVITMIVDGKPAASFALADVIRPESKQAVKRLHEMGIEVAMLTGDSKAVAESVARELGIDTFFAEVLPEHKDRNVRQLQAQGKRVAMVGDGVNDAPALTRSDLGIAIGSGTDVAVESADVILVRSNPLDVVNIIELSRSSYRKMVQNLVWATGYNVIALPLAAGVLAPWGILLSPAIGAVLMSVSTIIVALNAQLLRTTRFSAEQA